MNRDAGNGNHEIANIHHLKEEIDRLTVEQLEALKAATFVGMTRDEAKEYDERRAKIIRLIDELRQLELAQ